MNESYWIKPDGTLIHAPKGHQSYITEHWQELELPKDISLIDLVLNGWVRVSGDNIMLRQIESPEVLETLQLLLTTLGHDHYTFWINSKPHIISLKTLESSSIIDIYKGILSGKFEEPTLFPQADASDQGMFETQPSWGESESAGSTGMKDRGTEFMPQDTTKEVWWNRELLDYLRKNFPGKKDVIPPEPDIGYPSQASDIVTRMNRIAISDQEIICRHNRSNNKIPENLINPIAVLMTERMDISMDFAIQLIRSYNYHTATNPESVKMLDGLMRVDYSKIEREIREIMEEWKRHGSLNKKAELEGKRINIYYADHIEMNGQGITRITVDDEEMGVNSFFMALHEDIGGEYPDFYDNEVSMYIGASGYYDIDFDARPEVDLDKYNDYYRKNYDVAFIREDDERRRQIEMRPPLSERRRVGLEEEEYNEEKEREREINEIKEEWRRHGNKVVSAIEQVHQWDDRWIRRGNLKVQAWGPANYSQVLENAQDWTDTNNTVPKRFDFRNHHVELDENYIAHIFLYSTEIVTADMKNKVILMTTKGDWDTRTTKSNIDGILGDLRSLGYPGINDVEYEYDATETDEDREKQREQIKIDEKRRRHEKYLHKKRLIPLHKAQNPRTSPEELADLARVLDKHIRIGVARNPNTSVETLALLAKDEDVYVRAGVAENPNISIELLNILEKDENIHVQETVKRNPKYVSERKREINEIKEEWKRHGNKGEFRINNKTKIALTINNPQSQTPQQPQTQQVTPGLGQQHSTQDTAQQSLETNHSTNTHNAPNKNDLFKGLHDKHRDTIVFSNHRVRAWDNPDPSYEDSQTSPMEENMDNRLINPDDILYRRKKGRGSPYGEPSEEGELKCNLPASAIVKMRTANDVVEKYLVDREKGLATEPQIRQELLNKGITEQEIDKTYRDRSRDLFKQTK